MMLTREEALDILIMDRAGSFPIDANYVINNREEALDIAIDVLKKQIPIKPIHSYSDKCPICNNEVFSYDVERQIFCSNCGQRIDWSK